MRNTVNEQCIPSPQFNGLLLCSGCSVKGLVNSNCSYSIVITSTLCSVKVFIFGVCFLYRLCLLNVTSGRRRFGILYYYVEICRYQGVTVISDNIVHNNVYLRLHLQTLSIFHPSIGITLHNFSTGCGNKRENARQPIFGFFTLPWVQCLRNASQDVAIYLQPFPS